MRIAFFGGSFDPPHRGHLALAHAAIARLHLQRVMFAPVGSQPLKRDAAPASFDDRLAMVRLAIEGDPHLTLSTADAPLADGQPNYTIDTIATVRKELSQQDELFLLVGADAFLTMRHWHRAADLLAACPVIVAARPGFRLEDALTALPEGIVDAGEDETAHARRLHGPGGESLLYFLNDLAEDVSATEIRQALGQGDQPGSVLAPSVREYICSRGLYRDANIPVHELAACRPHPASKGFGGGKHA